MKIQPMHFTENPEKNVAQSVSQLVSQAMLFFQEYSGDSGEFMFILHWIN
jgi:hypothetical protein